MTKNHSQPYQNEKTADLKEFAVFILLAYLAGIVIKLLPLVNRADQDVKPFKCGILIFVVGK